jgi:hypothetical protein
MAKRLARTTGAFSGVLIAVLGMWGALIPFVGPYFNYSFGTNETWHYTTDRLWLCILPGAVALLGGLLLVAATRRATGVFGGWLAMGAGAWFAVGPAVSLTWERGPGPIGRPLFGSTRQMLELVGYFYGLGALIAALAAFAIGRFVAPTAIVREAPVAAPAAEERVPAAAAAPAAAAWPYGTRRDGFARRRRLPFLRRGLLARGEARGAQTPARSDSETPTR